MALRFIKCVAIKPGLFENLNIEFESGLNIIFGRNGSGKSFIARALVDSIWKNFCPAGLISNEGWEGFYIESTISLSSADRYKFTSNSRKSFSLKVLHDYIEEEIFQTSFKEHSSDAPIKMNGTSMPKELSAFMRLIDSSTYFNSSFIPSSSDIENTGLIGYEYLKKILLFDQSNYYNLSSSLKKSFQPENMMKNRLFTEILNQESRLKETRKKIEIIGIKNSRTQKLVREKNQLTREIDHLKNSLALLSSQKDTLVKILENLEKIEGLNDNLEKIKQEVMAEKEIIRSVSSMEKELGGMFPHFSKIDETSIENLDRLQAYFIEIRNINEKIDSINQANTKRARLFNRLSIILNVTAITAVVSIFINTASFTSALPTALMILGASAVLTPALFIINRFSSKKERLSNLSAAKDEILMKINTMLSSVSVNTDDIRLNEIYEFLLKYFEDYIEYSDKVEELNTLKNSLKSNQYLKDIEDSLNQLKMEEDSYKKEISRNIKFLDSIKDSDIEKDTISDMLRNIDSQVEMMKEQISFKENISAKVSEELLQNPEETRESTGLIEDQIKTEQRLTRLTSNRNALDFIIGLLDESVKKRESKQLEGLVDLSFSKFHFLTGNHYITKIDTDIIRSIITGSPISEMNQVIMHALILSVKFALSNFISDDRMSLPLIIDDPFQFMDDERTARLKEQVREIATRRQVIIFTHQKDKKDWGRHIEL